MKPTAMGVRPMASILVCLTLAMALLAGCGGPSGGGADAGSGGSQSEGAAASLDPADVAGIWLVQEAAGKDLQGFLDTGMLQAFVFQEDGTFKVEIRLYDAELDRVGDYAIDGDAIRFNLPEMGEASSGALTLSAPAVVDGVMTVEGDALATNDIATNGQETVAKRVTPEEYQGYIDQIAAMGPKRVAVGETVTTPTSTFTVNSLSYAEEVYPSDTSGYYSYIPDQDGSTFLVADVSFTNNGTEYAVPGYATEATFSVGENKYGASIDIDVGPRFDSMYSVDAKATARMYIYAAVPDAVANTGEVVLTWDIPDSQAYMQTYYKSSYPHDEFTVAMG